VASDLPTNLRRLIFFHHRNAREAAEVLDTTERTLSAWMTGARVPGYPNLMKLAGIYGIDPALLDGDPLKFAKQLADPERIEHAEREIAERREEADNRRRRKRLKPV
jgi:transcriptional regulator with XRE-family HTH domain